MKIDSEDLRYRLEDKMVGGQDYDDGLRETVKTIMEMENEKQRLKIYRNVRMKEKDIQIGDRIKVKLEGREYFAVAVKDEGDRMLFVFDEYLDDAQPMNVGGGTEGGYEASDLRKYLQGLAEKFPKKLKNRMATFKNGDYLRLLTMQEMFGLDEKYNNCDGQIEWFKNRRHRVAYRKNEAEWGWLQNVVSGAYFADVNNGGYAYANSASDSIGVRPAFAIQYL